MINMLRAGGTAAAAFVLVATATFAGPSMASRVDAAPTVHPVAAHTEATIEAGAYRADAVAAAQQMVQVAGTAVPRPRRLEALVRASASAETSTSEQDCHPGAAHFKSQAAPLPGHVAPPHVGS